MTRKLGRRGVHRKSKSRWSARITADGKFYYLGSFFHPQDAAFAYDVAYEHFNGWNEKNMNFPYEEAPGWVKLEVLEHILHSTDNALEELILEAQNDPK